MNKHDSFNCTNGTYGNFSDACNPEICEFYDSCKYYSESPDPDNARRVRNSVSFEKNAARCSRSISVPAPDEVELSSVNFESLGDILRYIIMLEDTTVATISEIIRNPSVRQSDLARTRHVARQRINTSLLYICRTHPELAQLFCLCVKKVTLARNRYVKHKPENVIGGHPDLF